MLPYVVDQYNEKEHTTTGVAPNEAEEKIRRKKAEAAGRKKEDGPALMVANLLEGKGGKGRGRLSQRGLPGIEGEEEEKYFVTD